MTIKLVPDHKGGKAEIIATHSNTAFYIKTPNVTSWLSHTTPEAAAEAWNAGAKELVPLSEVLELLQAHKDSYSSGYVINRANTQCIIDQFKQKYGVSE